MYKTLANIFISFIGAGILSLPNAFARSGVVLGTVFMLCLSSLAFYGILLLVDCKKVLEHKGVVCCHPLCRSLSLSLSLALLLLL